MLRSFVIVLLMSFPTAYGEQPHKNPSIGYLSGRSASTQSQRVDALRQGLRELGYVEEKNIIIEYRWADGELDRLPYLASDLVRLNVDVIVAPRGPAADAAYRATRTIPIVMAVTGEPVTNDLVSHLKSSARNFTGLTVLATDLCRKQVDLLRETDPKVSRVAVLWDAHEISFKEMEVMAQSLPPNVRLLGVPDPYSPEMSLKVAVRQRMDAVLLLPSPRIDLHLQRIAEYVGKSRLPAIYSDARWVDAGGFIAYGPSLPDLSRRLAFYVDKILRGIRPADLPMEQPTKFELLINLKTAKQIGLTIPPNVLARADRVIK